MNRSRPRRPLPPAAALGAALACALLGGCVQVWVPDPYSPAALEAAYGPGAGANAAAGAALGAALGAAIDAATPPPPVYYDPPPYPPYPPPRWR